MLMNSIKKYLSAHLTFKSQNIILINAKLDFKLERCINKKKIQEYPLKHYYLYCSLNDKFESQSNSKNNTHFLFHLKQHS